MMKKKIETSSWRGGGAYRVVAVVMFWFGSFTLYIYATN